MDSWRCSMAPARMITKLDGSPGKLENRKSLEPTVPFTRLPSALFDKSWTVLASGRWKMTDHITADESRAHWKCIQCLASRYDTHSHKHLLLEDNMATSCSMAKGRSCAPLLNYYCRRRAATNVASDCSSSAPLVQTSLMPADAASRSMVDCVPGDYAQIQVKRSETRGPSCFG